MQHQIDPKMIYIFINNRPIELQRVTGKAASLENDNVSNVMPVIFTESVLHRTSKLQDLKFRSMFLLKSTSN